MEINELKDGQNIGIEHGDICPICFEGEIVKFVEHNREITYCTNVDCKMEKIVNLEEQ